MRRSNYGYLLLALLVITGLAGTVTSISITSKERKFAATHLKDTKVDVLKSIKGLSQAQLDFKTKPDKWSIRECIYHIAISENTLWRLLQSTMKQPANPEKRSDIKLTDDQVIRMAEDRSRKFKTTQNLEPKNTPYKTLDEALESFKSIRTEHIKYMKTTTEDLRNHIAQLPVGWVDCYQICLFMSAHSNRHMQQIEELKAAPNFPSR
ncbi:MAG: DinB family protein [Bacteroidetes bacterium]|nr:MAG: DinB family protein [Bacteroidota bacterium]